MRTLLAMLLVSKYTLPTPYRELIRNLGSLLQSVLVRFVINNSEKRSLLKDDPIPLSRWWL
jgi:hypothetical protein